MAAWQNPDVHARTQEMREQMQKEFPLLPQLTELYSPSFDRSVAEIREKYIGDKEVAACLDKMTRRKDHVDMDLHVVDKMKGKIGVKPSGLLSLVWEDKIKPNDAFDHFLGTLKDMGTTCPQGDSHRLFATYVAFSR
jgi:uncharacterized protein YdhG (YjbR/CyaY superfamily)